MSVHTSISLVKKKPLRDEKATKKKRNNQPTEAALERNDQRGDYAADRLNNKEYEADDGRTPERTGIEGLHPSCAQLRCGLRFGASTEL